MVPLAATNPRSAECARCGLTIRPGAGDGSVHLGRCPSDRDNPDGAPTWLAEAPKDGRYHPPTRRASWPVGTPGAPPVDTVPGGRVVDQIASGIVTVVPHSNLSRPATAREAAPVLAKEVSQTDEVRAELADQPDLRGIVALLGCSVDCARILAERGHRGRELDHFRILDAADAEALNDDLIRRWRPDAWSGWRRPANFTPGEARRLLAAGIDGIRAERLHRAGFRTPEAVLAAQPPDIPDEATRIVFYTDVYGEQTQVTDDPAAARAWLADRPLSWQDDLVRVESGPRPVHVTESWSLWDDGRLVPTARWLGTRPDLQILGPAARAGLGLCVHAVNTDTAHDPAVWWPLCTAVAETRERISERGDSGVDDQGGRWGEGRVLTRHTFTLADGTRRTLWDQFRSSSYVGFDTSGSGHDYRIYTDEESAMRSMS